MDTAGDHRSATARNAHTQNGYRELNEAITGLSVGLGLGEDGGEPMEVMCECGRSGCSEPIKLSAEEYEAIRADGAHFVLVAGHEVDAVEHVVVRTPLYVVARNDGEAETIARKRDPRRVDRLIARRWRGQQ